MSQYFDTGIYLLSISTLPEYFGCRHSAVECRRVSLRSDSKSSKDRSSTVVSQHIPTENESSSKQQSDVSATKQQQSADSVEKQCSNSTAKANQTNAQSENHKTVKQCKSSVANSKQSSEAQKSNSAGFSRLFAAAMNRQKVGPKTTNSQDSEEMPESKNCHPTVSATNKPDVAKNSQPDSVVGPKTSHEKLVLHFLFIHISINF